MENERPLGSKHFQFVRVHTQVLVQYRRIRRTGTTQKKQNLLVIIPSRKVPHTVQQCIVVVQSLVLRTTHKASIPVSTLRFRWRFSPRFWNSGLPRGLLLAFCNVKSDCLENTLVPQLLSLCMCDLDFTLQNAHNSPRGNYFWPKF